MRRLGRSFFAVGSPAWVVATRLSSGVEDLSKRLSNLMHDFGEARELISEAKDAIGTTYYSEDASDAQEHTEKLLDEYSKLKESLKDAGQHESLRKVEREYDVKFAQLAAELEDVLDHE